MRAVFPKMRLPAWQIVFSLICVMSVFILCPLVAAGLAVSASADAAAVVATSMLPAVPDARGFAGSFAGVLGRRLVAGGGANFPDGVMPWDGGKKVWHDTLYALDLDTPETGWKIIGHLPQPNGYGVSLSVREGVVLIGGGDASRHFREVWLLTLTADGQPQFRPLPPLAVSLAQMCAAQVGRQIHLCGGIQTPDAVVASNAHCMLDLDALDQAWQPMPPLPAAGRILATAAAVDGAFYCLAGCSLAPDAAGKPLRTYLRDAWKFFDGRWSRIADLPHPLVAAASPAPVAGSAVFVVSGDDGSQIGLSSPAAHTGFSKEVLRYDTRHDNWSTAGELGVTPPVTAAVAPWRGDFIFFNGEIRPGVRTPQVFLFTPPASTPAAHE